jgi:hypothetical protein
VKDALYYASWAFALLSGIGNAFLARRTYREHRASFMAALDFREAERIMLWLSLQTLHAPNAFMPHWAMVLMIQENRRIERIKAVDQSIETVMVDV